LRQRRTHGPVGVLADRGTQREVSNAAGEVVVRKQLLRRVERTGRQQVDLAGKRRAGEKIGRQLRGRSERVVPESPRTERAFVARQAREEFVGDRRFLEDASAQMTQPPRDVGVIVR